MRRSIREECSPLLGAEAFDMRVDDLTDRQKYDLVFTRIHNLKRLSDRFLLWIFFPV
mgnify:CR=1 FL=1